MFNGKDNSATAIAKINKKLWTLSLISIDRLNVYQKSIKHQICVCGMKEFLLKIYIEC